MLQNNHSKGGIRMLSNNTTPTAEFVNMIFVDEKYHENHSQLVHSHNDVLELLYIMHGNGQYIVNGKQYVVQPGNLIVCSANVMHGETLNWKNNMLSYCCVLQGLALPSLPENTLLSASSNPVFFFAEDRAPVEHIILAIYELFTRLPAQKEACNLLANALLNIVYTKAQIRKISDKAIHKNNEDFIQNIVDYLDKHFTEPLSLQDLGNKFHISPSYLSHIFKAEIGLPLMKYLMYRRIGEAQSLLMNTSLPINAIGEQLGFHDTAHFSRMFKKYIGTTCSEYREHFRNKNNET